MDPIHNDKSTVNLDHEGNFVVEWKDDVVLQREDIEKVVNDYDEMSQGELWKVLHVFPKKTKVSTSAQSYAEQREKPAKAEAFVIQSIPQRLLFKFYRKFRRHDYPMREFASREEAEEWLRTK